MTRRLLLAYLTITAFALVVVVVPLGVTFASRERDRLVFDLERDAQAIGSRVEDDLEGGTPPDLAGVFEQYAIPDGRIVVTDAQGISVADSSTFEVGRDYSSRPEFQRALSGERATGERRSDTLDTNLVFVAVPVASNGVIHGAVRVTVPTGTVDDRVQDTWLRLAALSAVVLATVGAVGLILARSVTRPVRKVEDAARRLASGDLSARAGEVRGPPELTALAHQFDTTAERLEQLVDSQRRFVGDASHQLRTPLTALRLRLETLDPSPADEPRVAAALAETDRLTRLVQSLLVIARSESAEPTVADVDLRQIADQRADALAAVAERESVALAVEGPDHVVVAAVEGGPEQMIDNLVANAIAVSPPETTIRIVVGPRDGGGGRLEVIDEGPGMTPEQRSQATARFWRAAGTRSAGSGLGLSIVDHLAMAAGGELTLEAGPDDRGLRAVVDFAPPLVRRGARGDS